MSAPMISWLPIAEFMAMQAMEEAYGRFGDALRAHDIMGFAHLLADDYRCITFDGGIADRKETLEQVASLFDCESDSIEFRARIVAVSEYENMMRVRAVKELLLGDTAVSVEDVEEIWRFEEGEWLLAETRMCGG